MKFWYSLSLGIFLSITNEFPIKAQISPDGTTNTLVTPIDNGLRIDNGDRAGDNLFHSFEGFSVSDNSEAFFNNPNDIVNIFSRVTGVDISNIDGLIRANGEANLFLINPAGIIFGEGAALDIGGSFFASTAESIVFTDDLEFAATDRNSEPLLTINMPLGLNFGNNPGNIAVNGSNLQVNNGETLALIGGNVTITGGESGFISAPGGRIELGGVSESGQITFNREQLEELGSIKFLEGVARADVILSNAAEVDVRGTDGGSIGVNARNIEITRGELGTSNLRAGITPESDSTEAQGGDIALNATENITVSQGSGIRNRVEESGVGNAGSISITTANLFLTGGGFLSASTSGQGNAGTITINAFETISADGQNEEGFNSGIFSQVRDTAVGNSGGIDITTANLSLTQGGIISAGTSGRGNTGAITIDASETISAIGEDQDGFNTGIVSQVGDTGVGNSNGIDITTANLLLVEGGIISAGTFGRGNAGAITIDASGSISATGEDRDGFNTGIYSQIENTGVGNAGGIDIATANLSLTRGGVVSAGTLGQGNGGIITVKASGTISVDGKDEEGLSFGFSSGIYSAVEGTGVGNAGGINITTTNLFLTQGGVVTTSTLASGEGNAGEITINASETISADGQTQDGDNSGIFSAVDESGVGNAGDININTNNLSIKNNAQISVESLGQGEAGNLLIQANSLALENGAALFASTPIGTGGSITLQIADNLTLRDNSTISAQAIEEADGGNIDIDAGFIVAFPNQNNDIIARAAQGMGGNIDLTTNALFGIQERSSTPPNNTNDIDPSSQFGLDGTVSINELDVNPAEALEELPIEVIDVARLVAQNLCQQAKGSEFIVTGKGGIAPSPTQARDGEIGEVDLVEPAPLMEDRGDGGAEGAEGDGEAGKEVVEAQGWMINDRGILELVAYKTDINGSSPQPKDSRICNAMIEY